MILAGHSDYGFNNETRARSRSGAHIFFSENESITHWNGPILTIAQILKYVVSSAAEAEMNALFLMAKEMVLLRHTGRLGPSSILSCSYESGCLPSQYF